MLLFLSESNHTIEPGGSWTDWGGGILLVDIRQVALHIVTLYNSQSIFFFHKVDHLANKPVRVFPKLFTILIFLPCSSFLTCNSRLDLRSSAGLYLVINIGKLFLDSLFFLFLQCIGIILLHYLFSKEFIWKFQQCIMFLILSLLICYSVPLVKSHLSSSWSAEFAMVPIHDSAPYISLGMW